MNISQKFGVGISIFALGTATGWIGKEHQQTSEPPIPNLKKDISLLVESYDNARKAVTDFESYSSQLVGVDLANSFLSMGNEIQMTVNPLASEFGEFSPLPKRPFVSLEIEDRFVQTVKNRY